MLTARFPGVFASIALRCSCPIYKTRPGLGTCQIPPTSWGPVDYLAVNTVMETSRQGPPLFEAELRKSLPGRLRHEQTALPGDSVHPGQLRDRLRQQTQAEGLQAS